MYKIASHKQIWGQNPWLVTSVILCMLSWSFWLVHLHCLLQSLLDIESVIPLWCQSLILRKKCFCSNQWCLIFHDECSLVPPQVGGSAANYHGNVFCLHRTHVHSASRFCEAAELGGSSGGGCWLHRQPLTTIAAWRRTCSVFSCSPHSCKRKFVLWRHCWRRCVVLLGNR